MKRSRRAAELDRERSLTPAETLNGEVGESYGSELATGGKLNPDQRVRATPFQHRYERKLRTHTRERTEGEGAEIENKMARRGTKLNWGGVGGRMVELIKFGARTKKSLFVQTTWHMDKALFFFCLERGQTWRRRQTKKNGDHAQWQAAMNAALRSITVPIAGRGR